MSRSFSHSTFLVWTLGIGLSLSSGHSAAAAPGDVANSPGKPVQSNSSTASSGRRPLAVRIAMADRVKPGEPKPPTPAGIQTDPPSATRPQEALVAANVPRVDVSAATPSSGAEKPAVPRLLLDCEESTIEARHGESIRWRITIRNAGAAAHHVLATVYFAEGIEPTGAEGHRHALSAGEARFSPVETLGEDEAIQLEVIGRAVRPGAVAYRVEVGCRDLPGHVAREAMILVRPKAAD